MAVLFDGNSPQMMNYPVTHHLRVMLSRCSNRSALSSWVVEEGDVTEEDEEDDDGIRFATLESRFENKEAGLNW